MVLPITIPIPQEQVVATYTFTELAEGTGIVQYKLFTTTASGGDDHHLGTQDLYSSLIDTKTIVTDAHTSFTKITDLDFDLSEFNLTKTIKGTAIFQFSMLAKSGGAANRQLESYFIIRLRKWDGTTETEIASVQTATLTPAANGGEEEAIVTLTMTVPRTHFKIGDNLRLTIEGWGKTVDAGTPAGELFIGHDPQNRDSTEANGIKPSTDDLIQTFDAYIPFRIDL